MNPVSRSAHEFSIEVALCTPKPMFFFSPIQEGTQAKKAPLIEF
jgi:hypothetical protein